MNAIHLLPFRPTYYFCMDVNEQDTQWQQAVQANLNCTRLFLLNEWKDLFTGRITWMPRCKKHHYYAADNWKRAEQWHLPEICTAFGSMYAVLQLAATGGADEIYLVGCDLFEGNKAHFDEQYPAFVDQNGRNMIEKHIHTVAKRSCPVPIFNATIGGTLDIHPRVDFLKVVNG